MIEQQLVERMVRRGLLLAPAVVVTLWLLGGSGYAVSSAAGVVMALGNLWASGRIIGGVADRTPKLLLAAGIATFALGLIVLTGVALLLQALDLVAFSVTGLTLVGVHLSVVLWEAAAGGPVPAPQDSPGARTPGTAKTASGYRR